MLDQEDKDFLVKEIRKAVREELTVKLSYQQVRDLETGKPLATPILHPPEDVFLPAFFVEQLMFNEGAFRGMQEDVSKSIAQTSISKEGINALAQILIEMENGINSFVKLGSRIEKQLEYKETKQIESDNQ